MHIVTTIIVKVHTTAPQMNMAVPLQYFVIVFALKLRSSLNLPDVSLCGMKVESSKTDSGFEFCVSEIFESS